MSKSARKPRLINDVVVLPNDQIDLYYQDCLTLKDMKGHVIDVISHINDHAHDDDNRQDAVNRLRLFEVLFSNQSDGVELDANAVAGLSDIFTNTI